MYSNRKHYFISNYYCFYCILHTKNNPKCLKGMYIIIITIIIINNNLTLN